MNREKVAGENFRDGSMEVAFELWIERKTCYYSWVRGDFAKQNLNIAPNRYYERLQGRE